MIKILTNNEAAREFIFAEIKELTTSTTPSGKKRIVVKLDDDKEYIAVDREIDHGPATGIEKLKASAGSKMLISVSRKDDVNYINDLAYPKSLMRFKEGEYDKYLLCTYPCHVREFGNGNISVSCPIRGRDGETEWYGVSFLGDSKRAAAEKQLEKGSKLYAILADSLRSTTAPSGKVYKDLIGRYMVALD